MEKKKLTQIYTNYFVNNYKRKYDRFFHSYFLKYFDLETFIKCFDNKMKEFCKYVHSDFDLEGNEGIYFYLVEFIFDEIQPIMIKDVHEKIGGIERHYYFEKVSKRQFVGAIKKETEKYNAELFKGESRHLFQDWGLKKPSIIDPSINDIFDRVFSKYEFIFAVANKHNSEARKKLQKDNVEKSRRNYLYGTSLKHKRYYGFITKILSSLKITKYQVVQNFTRTEEGVEFDANSVRGSFDSFLRNHKEEILKDFGITETTFKKRFFPRLS